MLALRRPWTNLRTVLGDDKKILPPFAVSCGPITITEWKLFEGNDDLHKEDMQSLIKNQDADNQIVGLLDDEKENYCQWLSNKTKQLYRILRFDEFDHCFYEISFFEHEWRMEILRDQSTFFVTDLATRHPSFFVARSLSVDRLEI
jgi:hypothetical protein